MKAAPPSSVSSRISSSSAHARPYGLSFGRISGWAAFRQGAYKALPIAVGYFPIAVAFGIASVEIGVPSWVAILMSLTTFGGASQMVALSLLAGGQAVATIVLAVFVVNSRFFLLSMALTDRVAHWPWLRKSLFGLWLTDEVFAVLMAPSATPRRRFRSMETLGMVFFPMTVWVLATAIGCATADKFGDMRRIGLDFALVALLLAVLASQIRNPVRLCVALVAGACSVAFHCCGQSTLAVVFSTMVACGAGLSLTIWLEKRKATRV